MSKYNIIIYPLICFIFIAYSVYSGISSLNEMSNTQHNLKEQTRLANIEKINQLNQHKFQLKEIDINNLISGELGGSFLLIGGSVYGRINENQYLNVIYFDDDSIINNVTNVFRVTKFNLENIEIVSIPKNESPYFKYIDNDIKNYCDFESCNRNEVILGTPRLFLPDGWAILTK